uniref:Pentatricopeptide repeat-containing protein n=1 Tax=Fagus sylvatica TaxID=28930 RepID=A0A2N9FGS2_FAGSY
MVGKWVSPNHYTFPLLVKVCADIGSLREGEKAHARVVKFGFESDLFVRNSLIHMYSVCGRIGDARMVFDAGPDWDLVIWNTMIDGYVKNGEVGIARELFDEMNERDVFSWNSMISGYVGIGDMEVAKGLFVRMTTRDVVSWNCMIDGYARIGNVLVARYFFDQMPLRNVVSWNMMLALYVRSKDYNECLRLFDSMIEGGEHGFKNRTGPTGSTGDQCPIRSGLAVNGGERKIALLGGCTTKEVNDSVPGVELGPRWVRTGSHFFLGLSCPFSLFTLSLSQAEGTRSFRRWWVGSSPATFGCLRNPLEVLDLNLSFLLSCSTTVVRMGFSPTS